MMRIRFSYLSCLFLFSFSSIAEVEIIVKAAPEGDAMTIANKMIKEDHPSCQNVTDAVRNHEGLIIASCDEKKYLITTVFFPDTKVSLVTAFDCKKMNIPC